eukprot:12401839-Karenia_brevis.AAC.1
MILGRRCGRARAQWWRAFTNVNLEPRHVQTSTSSSQRIYGLATMISFTMWMECFVETIRRCVTGITSSFMVVKPVAMENGSQTFVGCDATS